jgi:hypothetical protein
VIFAPPQTGVRGAGWPAPGPGAGLVQRLPPQVLATAAGDAGEVPAGRSPPVGPRGSVPVGPGGASPLLSFRPACSRGKRFRVLWKTCAGRDRCEPTRLRESSGPLTWCGRGDDGRHGTGASNLVAAAAGLPILLSASPAGKGRTRRAGPAADVHAAAPVRPAAPHLYRASDGMGGAGGGRLDGARPGGLVRTEEAGERPAAKAARTWPRRCPGLRRRSDGAGVTRPE